MKIGFFGDSFCMEFENIHSEKYKYNTYLTMIKEHYSADIVNLGEGGSSVWDVIINQFPTFADNPPDVCIFCWSNSDRLFHRTFRCLSPGNVLNVKEKDITEDYHTQKDVLDAAKQYYTKLHDWEKSQLESKAALHYFDDYVLSKISEKTKIIHLWSFYKYYDFKHGIEFETPLIKITELPNHHPEEEFAPNHFGDEEKNIKVFNILKSIID